MSKAKSPIFGTPALARKRGYKTDILSENFYMAEDTNGLHQLIYKGRPFLKFGEEVFGLGYKLFYKPIIAKDEMVEYVPDYVLILQPDGFNLKVFM